MVSKVSGDVVQNTFDGLMKELENVRYTWINSSQKKQQIQSIARQAIELTKTAQKATEEEMAFYTKLSNKLKPTEERLDTISEKISGILVAPELLALEEKIPEIIAQFRDMNEQQRIELLKGEQVQSLIASAQQVSEQLQRLAESCLSLLFTRATKAEQDPFKDINAFQVHRNHVMGLYNDTVAWVQTINEYRNCLSFEKLCSIVAQTKKPSMLGWFKDHPFLSILLILCVGKIGYKLSP